MNFVSNKNSAMLEATHKYLKAWQPSEDKGASLEQLLGQVASPQGIMYKADGVVHMHDRKKSIPELAAHIRERYAAYKHVVHDAFAIALNEEKNEAFLGVRYIMQNTGSVLGQEPTGRSSQGVLLERLEFDSDNKISSALVCRQLTREEQDALTNDPSAVHPPPIDDNVLYAPQEQLSEGDLATMRTNLSTWVHAWDSDSDLSNLKTALAHNVKQLAGYGLGKRSLPFEGIDAAHKAVTSARAHLDNTNTVVSQALCTDRRAGFVHWQGTGLPENSAKLQVLQGLDYVRFNSQGQVDLILSFTMRPYSNIKPESDVPRTGGVD